MTWYNAKPNIELNKCLVVMPIKLISFVSHPPRENIEIPLSEEFKRVPDYSTLFENIPTVSVFGAALALLLITVQC